MSENYIGEIRLVAFTFAPVGWALCDGATLAIEQNDVLFSLIGTTYGGDGQNTFNLPNLQGRTPLHVGSGPGLSPRTLGEAGGANSVTLVVNNLPPHQHPAKVSSQAPTVANPDGGVLAQPTDALYGQFGGGAGNFGVTGNGGGSPSPHENRQPYLAMNYIIALTGIYPSQG